MRPPQSVVMQGTSITTTKSLAGDNNVFIASIVKGAVELFPSGAYYLSGGC